MALICGRGRSIGKRQTGVSHRSFHSFRKEVAQQFYLTLYGSPIQNQMQAHVNTRHFLAYSLLACCLLSLIGCMLYTTKYSRSYTSSGCSQAVFSADLIGSDLCCDDVINLRDSDWICVSAFDSWNKYFTAFAPSIYLPLLPWLLHFLFTFREEKHFFSDKIKRLLLYVGIIMFRIHGLYIGFSYLQGIYNSNSISNNDKSSKTCWYSPQLAHNCHKEIFDFSDHIVFYMVQMVLPVIIELAHVFGDSKRIMKNGDTNKDSPTIKKENKRNVIHVGHIFILCYSFALLYISLRAIFFTCLFFHTPMECLIAIGIVLATYMSFFVLYL